MFGLQAEPRTAPRHPGCFKHCRPPEYCRLRQPGRQIPRQWSCNSLPEACFSQIQCRGQAVSRPLSVEATSAVAQQIVFKPNRRHRKVSDLLTLIIALKKQNDFKFVVNVQTVFVFLCVNSCCGYVSHPSIFHKCFSSTSQEGQHVRADKIACNLETISLASAGFWPTGGNLHEHRQKHKLHTNNCGGNRTQTMQE